MSASRPDEAQTHQGPPHRPSPALSRPLSAPKDHTGPQPPRSQRSGAPRAPSSASRAGSPAGPSRTTSRSSSTRAARPPSRARSWPRCVFAQSSLARRSPPDRPPPGSSPGSGARAAAAAGGRSRACVGTRRTSRPPSPIGARSRAIVAVASDAMLRVSEIAALSVADLALEEDGSGRLAIRHSKTDQEGEGAVAYVGAPTVRRVRAWLAAAELENGPMFRRVRTGDVIGSGRLGVRTVRAIISLAYHRRRAPRTADLILIPCRPAAADLSAIGASIAIAQRTSIRTFAILNARRSGTRSSTKPGPRSRATTWAWLPSSSTTASTTCTRSRAGAPRRRPRPGPRPRTSSPENGRRAALLASGHPAGNQGSPHPRDAGDVESPAPPRDRRRHDAAGPRRASIRAVARGHDGQ